MKILLALLFIPALAFAQPQGIEGCAGCHGARGEGNVQKGFPRLAGQPQPYLQRQLNAYIEGKRSNPVMGPIAKQLTPQQRQELAAYYAKLQAPAKTNASGGGTSANARGHTLATRGDEAKRLQACENCHGPGGSGQQNLNPYLAGQERRYLEAVLQEWKDGSRRTDPSQQMNQIAKGLTDADIKAIAAYYANQPAPSTVSTRMKRVEKGSGVSGGKPSGSQGPGGAGTQ
jgi:cytochrome c553